MTNQEIFDKVLFELRKQGRASVSEYGTCMYRGINGTKCAVGHLIPDEEYVPHIERCPVDRIRYSATQSAAIALDQTLQRSGIRPDQYPLLVKLQDAHDFNLREWGVDSWEAKMRTVADIFDLEYTKP